MDEKLETSASLGADTVAADVGRGPESAPPATIPSLDLNELQELPGKKLEALARNLDLHLHPARSLHQHVLDIIRAGLSIAATVTAEGFLDQVSDSFAMLRWPELNFLPVPEDVCVPRAVIEQYHLRPGQKIAGTIRLPGDREKFLTLEKLVTRRNFRRAESCWKIQGQIRSARGRLICWRRSGEDSAVSSWRRRE